MTLKSVIELNRRKLNLSCCELASRGTGQE